MYVCMYNINIYRELKNMFQMGILRGVASNAIDSLLQGSYN